MTKNKLAKELLKIAKELTAKSVNADHGDIAIYFNVYDLVKFDKDFDNDESADTINRITQKYYDGPLHNKWQKDMKALVQEMFKKGELQKGITPKN